MLFGQTYLVLVIILNLTVNVMNENQMKGRIVKGKVANIDKFSYAAYLKSVCGDGEYLCGGSIVNQRIIMTAAHCVASCSRGDRMMATVGNGNIMNGIMYKIDDYKVHERYSTESYSNDIALMRTNRDISFNSKVTRVALAKKVPYGQDGSVAGWGAIDEMDTLTNNLLFISHIRLWNRRQCEKELGPVPQGAFCAGYKRDIKYPYKGDSGSALIVGGYIQVGLVSYNEPEFSKSLTIYTSIPHFYQWIQDSVQELLCENYG